MSDETNAVANAAENTTEEQGTTLLTGPDATEKEENKPAEETKAEEKPAEESKPAEPEYFELTAAPDGYPITDADMKKLNEMCKEAKLTKEQGEVVLKYMHGNYTAYQESQAAQLKKWVEEAKADKEFGGDNFDENVADAKRGLATFDTDGSIRAMLEETGYGSNPAVLKIFARVGKALGEDRLVGSSGKKQDEKPLEDRLWPDMK
ncbi:MAG: hypothetical protein K6F46_11705 [Desulfovibrio sp.]|nr:hypothetical protein [Desulfovibrio sp.]